MGMLYLVRHGQASFGSHDYDRLSELGHRQCRALGEHFRSMNVSFRTVLTGTLRRHRETYEGIAEGLGQHQAPEIWPGLDEYDPQAVVRAIYPGELPRPDAPDSPDRRGPWALPVFQELIRRGLDWAAQRRPF